MRKIAQFPVPDNLDILENLANGKTGSISTRDEIASRRGCLTDAYERYQREYSKPTYLSEHVMELVKVADLLGKKYDNASSNQWLDFISDRRYNHNCLCCPYCGGPAHYTLDHYLPKEAGFGHLAIYSGNLVPSCSFCQSAKHKLVPKNPVDRCVHPYFDDVNELVAVVVTPKLDPLDIYTATFGYQVLKVAAGDRATNAQKLTKAHVGHVKLEERLDVKHHFEGTWKRTVEGAIDARRKGVTADYYVKSLIANFCEGCLKQHDPALLGIARDMTLYRGILHDSTCVQAIDAYAAWQSLKPKEPSLAERYMAPIIEVIEFAAV